MHISSISSPLGLKFMSEITSKPCYYRWELKDHLPYTKLDLSVLETRPDIRKYTHT